MPEQDEFRQLSLGETLGKTFRICFSRIDVFLPLSLTVTVPVTVTSLLFATYLAGLMERDDHFDFWDFFVGNLGLCISYFLFQAIFSVVLFFSAEGAMVFATAEIQAGRSPQWLSCIRRGFQNLCKLICARVLVWFFLASTLSLLLGLSFALVQTESSSVYFLVTILSISYFGVGFTVCMTVMILYPVVLIEKKGPVEAIRRSFTLARGMRCYFFCSALCLWVTKLVALGVLQSIFADASKVSSLISVAGVLVTSLGSMFSIPLTAILCTVMYTSTRVRFGGFSRQDLLRDLDLLDQNDEAIDERQVPLLAGTDEVEEPAVPPLVENVIVVNEKEVPTDIPEASEVV